MVAWPQAWLMTNVSLAGSGDLVGCARFGSARRRRRRLDRVRRSCAGDDADARGQTRSAPSPSSFARGHQGRRSAAVARPRSFGRGFHARFRAVRRYPLQASEVARAAREHELERERAPPSEVPCRTAARARRVTCLLGGKGPGSESSGEDDDAIESAIRSPSPRHDHAFRRFAVPRQARKRRGQDAPRPSTDSTVRWGPRWAWFHRVISKSQPSIEDAASLRHPTRRRVTRPPLRSRSGRARGRSRAARRRRRDAGGRGWARTSCT